VLFLEMRLVIVDSFSYLLLADMVARIVQ